MIVHFVRREKVEMKKTDRLIRGVIERNDQEKRKGPQRIIKRTYDEYITYINGQSNPLSRPKSSMPSYVRRERMSK